MMENLVPSLVLGGQMMLIGMGFVLFFLCLLIGAMLVMSKVVGYLNTIFPEPVAEVKKSGKKSNTASEDEAIAVAIAAVMAKRV